MYLRMVSKMPASPYIRYFAIKAKLRMRSIYRKNGINHRSIILEGFEVG